MIYLHSGRPGGGKTLAAVERGVAWVQEGRRVFELGVNGCDHAATGIQPFPGSFEQWAELLRPGDVLIVDEVQQHLPKGFTLRSVPAWVEAMSRNRHFGIDMLWTTQDPRNMDSFPRRFINEHRHYVNKWGRDEAVVYTWPSGVEEPDSMTEKNRADKVTWKYPEQLFSLYTSAQLHTRKPSTPRYLKLAKISMGVAAVCLLVGVVVVRFWFMKGAEPHSSEPAHVAASAALFPQSEERYSARKPLSTEEWAARMTPRVEGLMWTAPIFDDRKPQAEPETYCMAIEGGRCNCITEQGTKVAIPVHQCREIVANAGVYNPYRKPRQDRLDWRETRREAVTDVRSIDGSVVDRAAISPGAVASDGLVGGRSSTGSNPMQVPQPANRMDAARW